MRRHVDRPSSHSSSSSPSSPLSLPAAAPAPSSPAAGTASTASASTPPGCSAGSGARRTGPRSAAACRTARSAAGSGPGGRRCSSSSPTTSPRSRIVGNDLFKQDWPSRKKNHIFQYVVLKWALVLLIGLLTGLVGFFNNLAVENIAGHKLVLTGDLMLQKSNGVM